MPIKKKRLKKKGQFKKEIKTITQDIEQEAKKTTKEVKKEVILNIPNTITFLRIIFAFIFVYMLFSGYSKVALLIVFAIAAASDWFDGYFARRLKQQTITGARMDQVIDRVFSIIIVGAIFFFYFGEPGGKEIIVMLFLISARELIGIPGFLLALIRNKDPYKVRYIGKVTTFVQGFALGAVIFGVSWAILLAILTAIIGILAGIDYLRYSMG